MINEIGFFFNIPSDEFHPEIKELIKYNVITQEEAELYAKQDSDDFEFECEVMICDYKGNELYAGIEGAGAYNWIARRRIFPCEFSQEAIEALGYQAASKNCCSIS